MSLQTIVATAEIVSVLSVALTLIALIVSIRQSTKSQKAIAVQSLAAAITAVNISAMQSPAMGAALAKTMADWRSAGREERIIAHFFLFSFFKLLENAWYQRKAGVLDQAQWIGWETMLRKYYHAEGCVGRGGRHARMLIRRNFKSFFPKQGRQRMSAVWPN